MQVVKSHIWRNKGLVAYLFKLFRKQIDGILKTNLVNLSKYPQFPRNNVNTHFICSNFSLFVDLYDTITVLIMWKWISVRMSWSFSSRNVDACPLYIQYYSSCQQKTIFNIIVASINVYAVFEDSNRFGSRDMISENSRLNCPGFFKCFFTLNLPTEARLQVLGGNHISGK